MKELFRVRREYGSVYATAFDNGIVIPWKLLSIEDYIRFHQDSQRNLVPLACLEDEIFTKCVLDQSLVRQANYLSAGTVSVVAQNIWQFSGPQDIEAFNTDLEKSRQQVFHGEVSGIHQLVEVIGMAFPYKPEEIYTMDYQTLLERAVQAESKLIRLGILQEPISMKTGETEEKQVAEKPKVNAKQLWEEHRKALSKPDPPKVAPKKKKGKRGERWWKKSPVLEAKEHHNIDFDTERKEADTFALSGHEKADLPILRHQMVESTALIYKDLITEMAKKSTKPSKSR